MSLFKRAIVALSLILSTCIAMGQGRTITVSSPVGNDFLGKNNSVKFAITGASFEVLVRVRATFLADTTKSVTVEKRFTPQSDGKINDSITLNFADSTPQGKWKIDVTPIEKNTGGSQLIYSPNVFTINPVTVDVKLPLFNNLNPLTGAFVKGIVRISADLNEANVDTWKVSINNSDIPNNSGSSQTVNVLWDTNTITRDGTQTIDIRVEDKAKNSTNKGAVVTLDRVRPSAQITTPGPGTPIPPNSNIVVQVTVTDQFGESVDITGIDVIARTLSGGFITRVSRRGTSSSGNTVSWTGRIRWTSRLPKEFKIVVNVVDRAGNPGVKQEVRVKVGNR